MPHIEKREKGEKTTMKLNWETIGCVAMAASVIALLWVIIIFAITHWSQLPAMLQKI